VIPLDILISFSQMLKGPNKAGANPPQPAPCFALPPDRTIEDINFCY
jgi:hypothetical protein